LFIGQIDERGGAWPVNGLENLKAFTVAKDKVAGSNLRKKSVAVCLLNVVV
jgi:hypothetical protein